MLKEERFHLRITALVSPLLCSQLTHFSVKWSKVKKTAPPLLLVVRLFKTWAVVPEYIHPTSICTLDLPISTSLVIMHELASLPCPSLNPQEILKLTKVLNRSQRPRCQKLLTNFLFDKQQIFLANKGRILHLSDLKHQEKIIILWTSQHCCCPANEKN